MLFGQFDLVLTATTSCIDTIREVSEKNPNSSLDIWGIAGSISAIFPSSPDSIKIKTIISSIAVNNQLAGALLHSIMGPASQIFGLAAIIKIYKLIPFKFS